MQSIPQILVVDDDLEIRKLLGRYLDGQGFRVVLAASRREMEEALAAHPVDLIVLDVLLPDGSGLEACQGLRAQHNLTPIILLTALHEDVDRIIGLEIGADDYLGKPFNPRELVARIRAILRRANEPQPTVDTVQYRFSDFSVEPALRRVLDAAGSDIVLTGAEFDLLRVFLERPGRVLSRDQLLDLTQGRVADPLDRSIDVLISRLRRKLTPADGQPIFKTVRNGGYQLSVHVETGKADAP